MNKMLKLRSYMTTPDSTLMGNPAFVNRLQATAEQVAAEERNPKQNIFGRSLSFLKSSATHYLESINPRGKDLRFYALGGLTAAAGTALIWALPDGPQHLWVIPVTAGVWKGVATSLGTGLLSYAKYRGYLGSVEQIATNEAFSQGGQIEGSSGLAEDQVRATALGKAVRQLAREKNRAQLPWTKDQFESRLNDIAARFVLGERQPEADGNVPPLTADQIDKVNSVVDAIDKRIRDRENRYTVFKSRMASFTGGMAAATLGMNLTNFAFYQLSGEGLGQRIHEGLSAEPKTPLPAADQATPPPAATAIPPPVETPPPAIPPASAPVPAVPEAAAVEVAPPVTEPQGIMEGAAKRAIEAWQQTQQTGNLPQGDPETLARAAEVGSHFTEIDGSANSGIQEALAILKQNGFDNPSEATIKQVQERILHIAEDLANNSELPLASEDPAAYKETYTNLLNAHIEQFQTIARQALIESQPAALEKLIAYQPYSGNFDTLALLQAVQEQGLNLDIVRNGIGGDTSRILGTIYGGLDTTAGVHSNFIDSADWSNRLATTLRVGDRFEVEAFAKWVGIPQDQTVSVLQRLFSGDRVVFDQIVQALGATTPEKRAVVERIIEAASKNDPDALKIILAIGHWKRSGTLNIPANIKLLLEYKYGLNR